MMSNSLQGQLAADTLKLEQRFNKNWPLVAKPLSQTLMLWAQLLLSVFFRVLMACFENTLSRGEKQHLLGISELSFCHRIG